MKRMLYVSPSILPSRSANSIHVVQQCEALSGCNLKVTLVAKRNGAASSFLQEVKNSYGVRFASVDVVGVRNLVGFADQIMIAMRALWEWWWAKPAFDIVLSRNLYFSYFFACVLRRSLIFETHQLELGFRRRLQKAVAHSRNCATIVISEKLRELLSAHIGGAPRLLITLHDAAPEGLMPIPEKEKRAALSAVVGSDLSRWVATVGYFGQLSEGRGIELIEALAERRPNVVFVVFGGSEQEIALRRSASTAKNIIFAGFVRHSVAQHAMAACDILLMPYQTSVSIGIPGHDTARWMSPMKMFEYLASGSPIIASDLPVLHEVLVSNRTALFAAPSSIGAWLECLDKLVADPVLRQDIGQRGHASYLVNHTWNVRAERILDLSNSLDV